MSVFLGIIFIAFVSLGIGGLSSRGRFRYVPAASILMVAIASVYYFFKAEIINDAGFDFGTLVNFGLVVSKDNLDIFLVFTVASFANTLMIGDVKLERYFTIVVLPFMASLGCLIASNLFTFIVFLELLNIVFSYNFLTSNEISLDKKNSFIYYQGLSLLLMGLYLVSSLISFRSAIEPSIAALVLLIIGLSASFLRVVGLSVFVKIFEPKLNKALSLSFLTVLLPANLLFMSRYLAIGPQHVTNYVFGFCILMSLILFVEIIRSQTIELNFTSALNCLCIYVIFILLGQSEGQIEIYLTTFTVLSGMGLFIIRESACEIKSMSSAESCFGLTLVASFLMLPGSASRLSIGFSGYHLQLNSLGCYIFYLGFGLVLLLKLISIRESRQKSMINKDGQTSAISFTEGNQSILWIAYLLVTGLLSMFLNG